MLKLLVTLFAAILGSANLAALAEPFHLASQKNVLFDRLGSEQGLSQALATSFVQDKYGYIWVGTQEGLNRYDGFAFEQFYHSDSNPNSLSDDTIWFLHSDSQGRLWIGTEDGLNLFDFHTESFQRISPDTGLVNEFIAYTSAESDTGTFYVGTSHGLFELKSSETPKLAVVQGTENLKIRSLRMSLDDQSVWIGSERNGLYRFDPENRATVAFRHDYEGTPVAMDRNVRALLADSDGSLWIGTFDGGLSKLGPDGLVRHFAIDPSNPRALGSNRVRSLAQDRDGNVWVGTDRGLHLWDSQDGFSRFSNDLTNPRSLSENTVHSIYQDDGGVIWVGTYDGISKWNATVEMFPFFKRPLTSEDVAASSNVTSFVEDPAQNVWIGTLSGLMKWDASSGVLVSKKLDLNDSRVMSLGARGADIWVGTVTGGISVYSNAQLQNRFLKDESSSSISSNAITGFFTDSRDRLWITTWGGGVNLYTGENSFQRFPDSLGFSGEFSDLRCMDIVEVAENEFWVATDGGGVVILNPVTGDTSVLKHEPENPQSLASNSVITLLKDDDGVWIGTVDKGLSYYNLLTQSYTHYSRDSGLGSDAVYGLLKGADEKIWISGAKGLTALDPSTGEFQLFDTIHGLQSSDFNSGAYASFSDGSLAFGGINGFNVFYPSKIGRNEHEPSVMLTGFKLFNEDVDLGMPLGDLQSLVLDHDESVFSISFAALDYTSPEKNQYRYMLEGFDKKWNYHEGRKDATYTNLDAGSYKFVVEASNNDGVWNDKGAQLEIIVSPAPWFTWWAYCLYAAAIIFTAYRLFKYNSDRLQREAERRYSERLQLYIESLEEASDCILIADAAGVLMYANNTITHGLNKAPSEVIGESIWTVLFEEKEDVESAQKSLEQEGRYHGEVLVAGSDGGAVTHEVTIAHVQQSTLSEKAYVGISRDVTERKITEAELEAYRKNLEELVEERTAALQKEIAENKAIQVHLADSLQEKELLIKEVHHRVKNNMQVISSLLSIQAQGAGDDVYSNLLNESQQRIKSMALIHETLYQSADLLKIDFQEYIESLTTSLSRSYVVPGVSVLVDVNVENVELDLETAVPCGLVINELVSNSLKHAFKGKEGTGVIDIDFVISQRNYSLRIADNGIGLPEHFDLSKNTSMGMEIVSILTSQLEGELQAHNDEGAVFEISFPRVVNG